MTNRGGGERGTGSRMATSVALVCLMGGSGCDIGATTDTDESVGIVSQELGGNALKNSVRQLATAHGVTPIPAAPAVSDQLFALGQALMFDKELSGTRKISCMTCHHPTLETDDNRHLSLGEGGLGLGHERVGGAIIPRNAPPLFNLHAMDTFFWDGRIFEENGVVQIPINGIVSEQDPDVPRFDIAPISGEFSDAFDFGSLSAQGMFPVLSRDEMRGQRFTNGPNPNEFAESVGQVTIWQRLMARLGAIPEYVQLFEAAYPGTPFANMNFAHAANAMAGFEVRAFEARGSRWQQFLEGNNSALTHKELKGALDFFQSGCGSCHSGPLLTDQLMHNTGLRQFGPGKSDGPFDNDDFGAEAVSGDEDDRYRFRTPPLINVELTGPWGHNGQFSRLEDIVAHYADPEQSLSDYEIRDHVHPTELYLADMLVQNTDDVASRIDPLAVAPVQDVGNVVAFLKTLTDPASTSLASTVPASVPSGLPVSDGVAPVVGGTAQGTVTFSDLSADDACSGLDSYERVASERNQIATTWQQNSLTAPMNFFDMVFNTPLRPRGMPGVAVFDYDRDDDEDVFVTNGPGGANALFQNQLTQTGVARFEDVAEQAGVTAAATDSSGACYGDIDNDGDEDLFVVADKGRSHFYLNSGDGTFADISAASGTDVDGIGGTSCAFGDINGDGLLDLFVARAWDQESLVACFFDPFAPGIQHNELYVNSGGGVFTDVSDASGIRNLGGLPPWAAGAATITWSVSMVDYDLDGDVDIFTADDQCGLPHANLGGVDRGFLQIFDNDGTGVFTNRTVEAGTNQPSAWMGLSFGDFNSDGKLDFFSPSFGDWGKLFLGAPITLGDETSRWFLGGPNKTFYNPGVGGLKRMPFGWGTAARDFDNDGDTDISFHGSLDLWFVIDHSNPGSMLLNDGGANFGLDRGAFAVDHSRRSDSGVAAADFNGDGFTDLVTVSDSNTPSELPLFQYGGVDKEVGFFSVYDPTAYYTPVFQLIDRDPLNRPTNKLEERFAFDEDFVFDSGTVTVELNSADNGNRWVNVRLLGSVGVLPNAHANRDGIGAMVTFTPEGGQPVMAPVLGGASHLSQDSLAQGFGLGDTHKGSADILWPGGVRNRLDKLKHGERVVIPEIPCSYDTTASRNTYKACVDAALGTLRSQNIINQSYSSRLRNSALRAYDDTH